jgi:hypothetical protein
LKPLHRALIGLAIVAGAGCGASEMIVPPPPPPPPPAPNSIRLVSEAGDFIGNSQTYDYTQANAVITLTAIGPHLTILVKGDEKWTGEFEAPSGQSQLQAGMSAILDRYPFHDPAKGGLSWFGEGRGCNTLRGWFAVDKITYVGSSLTAIDLRFEQRCDNATAALRGTVHWRSDDVTVPPGPVNPPPAGLWQPTPGSTPPTGTYVYLQSEGGDYIGQGQTHTYTPANAQITLSANAGHLTVTVQGAKFWIGEFQAMSSLTQLQRGYYPGIKRWISSNPVKGGLDWFGDGRGCNTLQGWFVVDSVTYVSGVLSAIDLRFEQHCEGAGPALHGAIHWTG